mgnify:CR=1 FL=1
MNTVCALYVIAAVLISAALPSRVSGTGFPIANDPGPEHSWAIAFDGTNFLVGVQPSTGGTGAKLVSPSGVVLATVVAPRTGDTPHIAFDGTNYLLVWADHTPPQPANGVPVYGQFVSTLGSLVGSPFLVSQSTTVVEVDGVAFDGTNYLVVWEDEDPSGRDILGRFVTTTGGAAGIDFEISNGAGKEAALAFGATRFMVVWQEEFANTAHARFITPGGALQSVFTVHVSSMPGDSDASGVAFDGTNFLVAWSNQVGDLPTWDVLGQFVSPAAALVGNPIPITTATGTQVLPYIAFDGINYLVIWTDLANDANGNFSCDSGEGTCIDLYGQFLSASGSLVGTNFAVLVDPDNQAQSPVAYGGGKYLVAWNERFGTSSADVFGTFIASQPNELIFRNGFESP